MHIYMPSSTHYVPCNMHHQQSFVCFFTPSNFLSLETLGLSNSISLNKTNSMCPPAATALPAYRVIKRLNG